MTTATAYKYPAAQQAYELYGKSYADYIEQSTAEHVAKGFTHCATQSLGEALAGNDGN